MNVQPTTPLPKKSSMAGNVLMGVIAIGILSWVFWPSSPKVKEKEVFTAVNALIESRQFVEKELLAPASSDFDELTDRTTSLNDTVFKVNSFVDDSNAFGVKIRRNYTCKITFVPSLNRVLCDDLIIEGL